MSPASFRSPLVRVPDPPGRTPTIPHCASPHWVPELRPHTGLDEEVAAYVFGQDGTEEFVSSFHDMLQPVLEGYRRENKHYATIAVGCTGGKHRSVAVSAELARRLGQLPRVTVNLQHRDMGRE